MNAIQQDADKFYRENGMITCEYVPRESTEVMKQRIQQWLLSSVSQRVRNKRQFHAWFRN